MISHLSKYPYIMDDWTTIWPQLMEAGWVKIDETEGLEKQINITHPHTLSSTDQKQKWRYCYSTHSDHLLPGVTLFRSSLSLLMHISR